MHCEATLLFARSGTASAQADPGLTYLPLNGTRVGANSPSLWPTISAVIEMGTYCFPLWTRKRILGRELGFVRDGVPDKVGQHGAGASRGADGRVGLERLLDVRKGGEERP